MIASIDEVVDSLGAKLGEAALKMLVRLYPETANAPVDQLDAACAAMRAKSREVLDTLLADAKACPHLAEIAFTTAALSLAEEGIRVLKPDSPEPGKKP